MILFEQSEADRPLSWPESHSPTPVGRAGESAVRENRRAATGRCRRNRPGSHWNPATAATVATASAMVVLSRRTMAIQDAQPSGNDHPEVVTREDVRPNTGHSRVAHGPSLGEVSAERDDPERCEQSPDRTTEQGLATCSGSSGSTRAGSRWPHSRARERRGTAASPYRAAASQRGARPERIREDSRKSSPVVSARAYENSPARVE